MNSIPFLWPSKQHFIILKYPRNFRRYFINVTTKLLPDQLPASLCSQTFAASPYHWHSYNHPLISRQWRRQFWAFLLQDRNTTKGNWRHLLKIYSFFSSMKCYEFALWTLFQMGVKRIRHKWITNLLISWICFTLANE